MHDTRARRLARVVQPQSPARPPNIVLVLAEHEDLGAYASMPKALIEDQGVVGELLRGLPAVLRLTIGPSAPPSAC